MIAKDIINANLAEAIENMSPVTSGNVMLTFFYCYVVDACAPFRTEEHQHPTYELTFHLEGATLYTTVNGKDILLSKDNDRATLLPPCQLHRRRQRENADSRILSLCFGITDNTGTDEAICQKLNEQIMAKGCSLPMRPFYHQLISQMIRESPRSIFSSASLQGIILTLVTTILSDYFPCTVLELEYQDKLWPNDVEQAIAFTLCNRQGGPQVSLSELSKSYNLSARQLNRKFKQHYGKSIMEYQRELRLKNAKMLLTSTTKTITEIAYTFRFPSLQLFTRFFKKYEGISPSEYRLANSSKDKPELVK